MSVPNTQLFAVQVAIAGGHDFRPVTDFVGLSGNAAPVQVSYVYNVTDLSGTLLGSNMTPGKYRLPNRNYEVGFGIGTGYNDATGTFQLLDANERPR